MPFWKLTVAYDGTPFLGWQVQPGLPTVQGTLADAIRRITGEHVLPQGSGRTDTGVHALGQVASVELKTPIPGANLHRALNRCLPASIRVTACEQVQESFHARHRARAKTYEYRIYPLYTRPYVPHPRGASPECRDPKERICSPMLAPFCWPCPWALDLDRLNQAAAHILGTHDFSSFAASDPRGANPVSTHVRTVWSSQWHQDGELSVYRVRGSGFLHHMVRNLVGTFVLVGAGRLDPESIPAMLSAKRRSAAGPTAPASGLFLLSVEYESPNGEESGAADAWSPHDGDDE